MSARWEDALDAQLDAYLLATSVRGQRYLQGWTASAASKAQGTTDDPSGQRYANFIRDGAADIAAILFNAEPIHVEPEMQTLWEAACQDFVEEPLHETDLITDVGFVWLPRPHALVDIHGRPITQRAFLWQRIKDGIVLFMLHRLGDVDGYDDGSALQVPNVIRGAAAMGLQRGDIVVDGMYPWKFGDSPQYVGSDQKGTPMTHDTQVLFRLLQQTIVERSAGRPTRPVRRRCKRAEFPERSVVVVRLRRPRADTDPDKEPRSVEWSHRWLVSGHWRNQWFPSLSMHRQIYISPFIKGPDDKPLHVRKARIFDWSR